MKRRLVDNKFKNGQQIRKSDLKSKHRLVLLTGLSGYVRANNIPLLLSAKDIVILHMLWPILTTLTDAARNRLLLYSMTPFMTIRTATETQEVKIFEFPGTPGFFEKVIVLLFIVLGIFKMLKNLVSLSKLAICIWRLKILYKKVNDSTGSISKMQNSTLRGPKDPKKPPKSDKVVQVLTNLLFFIIAATIVWWAKVASVKNMDQQINDHIVPKNNDRAPIAKLIMSIYVKRSAINKELWENVVESLLNEKKLKAKLYLDLDSLPEEKLNEEERRLFNIVEILEKFVTEDGSISIPTDISDEELGEDVAKLWNILKEVSKLSAAPSVEQKNKEDNGSDE